MAPMKSRKCLQVLLTIAALVTLAEARSAKTKPVTDYFPVCKRNDPKVNECIAKVITDLKPKLIKGIPELRLTPLEPLNIPKMSLVEGENRFRFATTLTNLTINGLSQYTVVSSDFKLTGDTVKIHMVMTVPVLNMTSQYEMEGQILVLPIRGKGDCTFDFVKVKTAATTLGKIVKRSGQEYVDIQSVTWDIQVGGATVLFRNLFNGDKLLGDATNAFLNNNWKEAYETYKHLPQEAFGLVFRDIFNQVFKRYTIQELYPE